MKRIGILGSTGSIGTQTLALVNNDSNFKVCYLSAFSNVDLLIKQAKEFHPDAVCIVKDSELTKLQDELKEFANERKFRNEKDLQFFKNIDKKW